MLTETMNREERWREVQRTKQGQERAWAGEERTLEVDAGAEKGKPRTRARMGRVGEEPGGGVGGILPQAEKCVIANT